MERRLEGHEHYVHRILGQGKELTIKHIIGKWAKIDYGCINVKFPDFEHCTLVL